MLRDKAEGNGYHSPGSKESVVNQVIPELEERDSKRLGTDIWGLIRVTILTLLKAPNPLLSSS